MNDYSLMKCGICGVPWEVHRTDKDARDCKATPPSTYGVTAEFYGAVPFVAYPKARVDAVKANSDKNVFTNDRYENLVVPAGFPIEVIT